MQLSRSLVAASFLLLANAACSSDDGAPSDGTTEAPKGAHTGAGDGSGASNTPATTATSSSATTPPPSDAGTDASSAKKKAAEACTADADCESNVCFKGNKESYCSLKCTQANAVQVCVAPFGGQCNNQGYCRKP